MTPDAGGVVRRFLIHVLPDGFKGMQNPGGLIRSSAMNRPGQPNLDFGSRRRSTRQPPLQSYKLTWDGAATRMDRMNQRISYGARADRVLILTAKSID
jgi:hypothetical protein